MQRQRFRYAHGLRPAELRALRGDARRGSRHSRERPGIAHGRIGSERHRDPCVEKAPQRVEGIVLLGGELALVFLAEEAEEIGVRDHRRADAGELSAQRLRT